MGSHRPSRKWPIHPFLATDARRSIRHSLSEPMASRKYAADINVEKAQDTENWIRGATNWTGSVAVRCRDFLLWRIPLIVYLLSHLLSQARLHHSSKHSRRAQRPLHDHSKNSNTLFQFNWPHTQYPLVHPHHPIAKKLLATTSTLALITRVLMMAAHLRFS